MNHWDLIPGETVTLLRAGDRVLAEFRFRDTMHAVFTVEGEPWDLLLREDGNLLERTQWGLRIWRIAEQRPDSRTLVAAEAQNIMAARSSSSSTKGLIIGL